MDYTFYKDEYGGELPEEEFNKYLPKAKNVIFQYINYLVPFYKIKDTLEEYELNLDMAICYMIDFMDETGGTSIVNGSSDLDITNVQTDGFTFGTPRSTTTAESEIPSFNGIYVAPMTDSWIRNQLKRKGLMYRGGNRCGRLG